MNKKIVAIVPVRKGSKRIKNKNFKKFANSNLLEIKLKSLKKVNLIDQIIVSTDSPIAIKIAIKNAKNNNVSKRIKFVNTSISNFNSFKFDLIVSNPPYIARHQLKNLDIFIKKFEPKLALDGGNDGLDVMRKVIYKSRKILKNNGMLALEIGNGQYKKVSQILKLNKFKEKYIINDYKDNIRCILSVLNHY